MSNFFNRENLSQSIDFDEIISFNDEIISFDDEIISFNEITFLLSFIELTNSINFMFVFLLLLSITNFVIVEIDNKINNSSIENRVFA